MKRRGQVIVMVTLALIMMCGMLGLAVDLGWAYYMEKTSQAAADAAALAAVSKAYDTASGSGSWGSLDASPSPVGCSSGLGPVMGEGCVYAQRNGFTDSGRQMVSMAAAANSEPPTARRVGTVMYWATARVGERIPQLFSAVLGHTMGGATSRATAAIIRVEVPGQLYALDRQWDVGTPSGRTGNDFFIQGGGKVITGGDILLASTAGGSGGPAGENVYYAAEGSGGWSVRTESGATYVRGSGWVTEPGNFYVGPDPGVQTPPENGLRDGEQFWDPMRGIGQPPPPPVGVPCPVPGGNLTAYCATGTCGPGYYYAVDAKAPDPQTAPGTGAKLTMKGSVRFGAGGSCNSGSYAPGGFGEYVFFGGMVLPSEYVNFDPGRYVFAGVQPQGSSPGILLDGRTQTYIQDNTPLVGGQSVANTDAGEVFVFTDAAYKGGSNSEIPLWIPPAVQSVASQLQFGIVDLHAGQAAGKTEMNLHGLWEGDPGGSTPLPSNLAKFNGVLFWQDQRNSTVAYTPDGYYQCGQAFGKACADGRTIDMADPGTQWNGSPEMNLHATPGTHLFGIVYQPRGAWVVLHGGSEQLVSPITLISGAYEIRGGPTVRLMPMQRPLRRFAVALVE